MGSGYCLDRDGSGLDPCPVSFTDDDVAELCDLTNPRNGTNQDTFFTDLVLAAESVPDAGCGTGLLLHEARRRGHTGRQAGIDPDVTSLRRARRVEDVEWVKATAADIAWRGEFELATMTSHAFQCLITDEEVRASLAAIRRVLRDGGRFTFETRHPQARAWSSGSSATPATSPSPTAVFCAMWYRAETRGDVVDAVEVTALADGTVLREDPGSLRFLNTKALSAFLTEAGFETRNSTATGDAGRSHLKSSSTRELLMSAHGTWSI
jgi:SAM-dependent methyltransferase